MGTRHLLLKYLTRHCKMTSFLHLIHHPTYAHCDTPFMTCIISYIFWYHDVILRESLWQRYISPHSNLCSSPYRNDWNLKNAKIDKTDNTSNLWSSCLCILALSDFSHVGFIYLCCNDSLRMAPQCWKMYEYTYVINGAPQSAYVGWCIKWKNMHSMNNKKLF